MRRVSPWGTTVSLLTSLLLLGACAPSKTQTAANLAGTSETAPVSTTEKPDAETDIQALQQAFTTSVGDRVLFETDHWDLTPNDQGILRRQAAWLALHPRLALTIAGHSDERGTREYNLALGEKRATAASNFLAALGIDQSRMTVVSYGKEQPECSDATDTCWSRNRRAVTELTLQ